jgi:hypothetical protein
MRSAITQVVNRAHQKVRPVRARCGPPGSVGAWRTSGARGAIGALRPDETQSHLRARSSRPRFRERGASGAIASPCVSREVRGVKDRVDALGRESHSLIGRECRKRTVERLDGNRAVVVDAI